MRLTWIGSGTGAGYFVDLYETTDGKRIIIGAEREQDKPAREDVMRAFDTLHANQQFTQEGK